MLPAWMGDTLHLLISQRKAIPPSQRKTSALRQEAACNPCATPSHFYHPES